MGNSRYRKRRYKRDWPHIRLHHRRVQYLRHRYWFNGGPGYFHYGSHNTNHTFEAQIGYDFGPLALNWYTNFAGTDGVNNEGDRAYSSYISATVPFTLAGLEWTAEIGATPWATDFYNYSEDPVCNGSNGFAVCDISLGAAKEIRITDSFSVSKKLLQKSP